MDSDRETGGPSPVRDPGMGDRLPCSLGARLGQRGLGGELPWGSPQSWKSLIPAGGGTASGGSGHVGNCSKGGGPWPSGTCLESSGTHLLQPGGPQATAGWHCPERPGLKVPGSPMRSPSCSLEPSLLTSGGWGGKGPGQSPIRSSDLASLLLQEAQGGEAGNRCTCDMRAHSSNANHSPASCPFTSTLGTGRDVW